MGGILNNYTEQAFMLNRPRMVGKDGGAGRVDLCQYIIGYGDSVPRFNQRV